MAKDVDKWIAGIEQQLESLQTEDASLPIIQVTLLLEILKELRNRR